MATQEFKPAIKDKCFYCTGACCKDVVMEIDEPDDFEEFDNIRWYLYHKDVFVYMDDDEWHVGFRTVCDMLQDDYSCGVYAKRPEICREHSPKDCTEYTGPGYGQSAVFYDAYFENADQLDKWLIENDLEDMIRKEDEQKPPNFIAHNSEAKKLKGRIKS